MKMNKATRQLISDLWKFIEDVPEDDPERTDKFFALRERVRQFYANQKQQHGGRKS